MSGNVPPSDNKISILLVDDIAEARENIKKLLAFEPDFKVVGGASTGREGVEMAKELEPDIIIMDINMPDMDGLEATSIINKAVPTAAVIIMSVQTDTDYMRRAMLSGARDFLAKPVNMDELYNTIRTVYRNHEPIRRQYAAMGNMPDMRQMTRTGSDGEEQRAGHILVLYSPKGGVGVTTIATSLASGLMKEDIKVLLVDADLQFADVKDFLALQAQQTIVDLAPDVDDLDVELFENIVTTHDSGLKVLLGPARPEFSDEVPAGTVAKILEKVAVNYDFIVVDTSTALNENVLSIFDVATKIFLVSTPTLISIKSVRFVLDLFDQLGMEPDKTQIILNHVWDERKKSGTIPAERVQSYLKRPVIGKIPQADERLLLGAINKGVPIIAADRDQNKPPIKQLLELSDGVYHLLMGIDEGAGEEQETQKRKGIAGFLGR